MSSAIPLLRGFIAYLSIALVLMGTLVSGHAQAAHINGLSNADAMPCHHTLTAQDGNSVSNNFAPDLCRQLCLNKIPDTAIATAMAQHATSVLTESTQLGYITIPSGQQTTLASVAPTPRLSADRTRPPTPLTATRLLI